MRRKIKLFIFLVTIFAFLFPEDLTQNQSKIEIRKDYLAELIARKALEYLGAPYRLGGINLKGVDCSGLVFTVFKEVTGITLTRSTSALFNSLAEVNSELLSGDLVFFDTTGSVSHVGIYLGAKKIIHSASKGPKTGVIISSLEESYYKNRYVGARRILKPVQPVIYLTIGSTRIGTTLEASIKKESLIKLQVENKKIETDYIILSLIKTEPENRVEWQSKILPKKIAVYEFKLKEEGRYSIQFNEPQNILCLKVDFTID